MAVLTNFITDDELSEQVKSVLARPIGDTLATHWPSIVNAANRRALTEIKNALTRRGYTTAQIQLWDDGWVFQRYLGIYFSLKTLAAMQPDAYSSQNMEVWNMLPQLYGLDDTPAVMITTDGAIVDPANDYGQVAVGGFSSAGALFGYIDTQTDSRIGGTIET